MSLDALGILYGTDKSSLRHNFLVHYERQLSSLRDKSFNLIEIGVYNGASLYMWQAFFRNATIIGIDIATIAARHARERIKIEIGSQGDEEFLLAVSKKYPPHVIIDDGSHKSDHQIFTFERLFPAVESGGCYFVEDVSHLNQDCNGCNVSALSYFNNIQRGIVSHWRQPTDYSRLPRWAQADIARLELMPGLIAIWKSEPLDYQSNIEWIEDLVRRSERSESLLYLAEYLTRAGLLDRALQAARRGTKGVSPGLEAWFQIRISSILLRIGNPEEAVAAAQKAVELSSESAVAVEALERARRALAGCC
jgi:hypothetical protein